MRLLDVGLPARCAGCGGAEGWPMCSDCADRVAVIGPPWCERCGRPLEEPASRCDDCIPRGIDVARAPFVYDGPAAAAIRGMKFGGWHALAPHLGAAMAQVAPRSLPTIVTWVPLSRRRLSRRGFDQAQLLAGTVAAELGLRLRPTLLRRRSTAAQARRSGVERRAALAGAFRAAGPVPSEVVLADDVLTTGATAAAAAAALRDGGTRRVVLLTAARAIGGELPPRCRGGRRGAGSGLDPGRTMERSVSGTVVAREEVFR